MICPKCGAKLVSGTTVCPICGSRQRSAAPTGNSRERNTASARRTAGTAAGKKAVSQRNRYEEEDDYDYDDRYDEDQNLNNDYYDDDYEEDRPRKSRGILIGIILTCVVIMGVLIALIIMLIQGQGNKPYMPQTVNQSDVFGTPAPTPVPTEEETEAEPSIEDQGEQLKVDGSIYEKTEDGLVLVEYSGNSVIVRLPSEIGGYPVIAVGSHAFKNSSAVQYLELSRNIKRLDTFSLYDLTNLQEVFIPESVTEIRTYAFSRVKKCTTPADSFASQHMLRIAEQVVIGNELSVQNISQIPTVAPPPVQPSGAPVQPLPPVTQPPVTQPPVTQPPVTQPPVTEPPATEPSTPEESSTEESSSEEMSSEEFSTEESSSEEAAEPSGEEPSGSDPAATEPSGEEPSGSDPAATEPSTEEPSTEEPSTEEPTTEEPTTEEPTTEAPTERNAENVQSAIASAAQGSVVFFDYGDFGTGDGNEVGFAIVQTASGYACWYNDVSGSRVIKTFDPSVTSVSSSRIDLAGGSYYVLNGGGTTTIFAKDASVYAELPGTLDMGSMTLNTGSGTAYLSISEGVLCEYEAYEVSKDQVEGLTGGKKILKDIAAANGLADLSGARFWNRANGMIQIDLNNGTHVDLWKSNGTISGDITAAAGAVSGKYTSLQSITPGALPNPLTSAVALQADVPGSYDINGDGIEDQITWTRFSEDGGVTNYVVLNVNGTQVYKSSQDITNAVVEVCDLNNSTLGYHIVVLGTGSAGNFLNILDANFGVKFTLNSMSSVLQGRGTFADVADSGHIVFDADLEADGVFKMNLESPIAGVSANPYYVTVLFDSNTWSEKSGQMEYDIVDQTGSSVATLKDTTQYVSASTADASVVLPAGSPITPKKLVIGTDGNLFIYTETPSAGYILVDPNSEGTIY